MMKAREIINKLKVIRADATNYEIYDVIAGLSDVIREIARESGIKLDEEEEREWDEYVS